MIRRALRRIVERVLGVRIYRRVPRGVDVFSDLATSLPLFDPKLIVDVGANVGQSAAEYLARFPSAEVLSIEPSAANCTAIRARFGDHPRFRLRQAALGAGRGTARLCVTGPCDQYRITEEGSETVAVETLDTLGASYIDFLKIDAEGHDLAVLQGGAEMLRRGAVAVVQVEVGMNPENRLHVPLETVKAFLEGLGYRLFGLYEQVEEWPTRQPHLRRSNAVFIRS